MKTLACVSSLEARILLLLSVTASIGCATTPFAQVESVVRGNRLAAGADLQGVQVTRSAASLTTVKGMALQKGDRIVTDDTTEAVIVFGNAYEVILSPGTDISISPDIFVNIGSVIVKKLRELREKFTVETKYVNAGVEHTEFAVSVDRGDVVSVVVLEGTVTLESPTRSFSRQTVGARERKTINPRTALLVSPGERVPQEELDRTFGWGSRVEAIAFPAVVPDLTGASLAQARTQLSQAGLRVGRIQRVVGEPVGTVLRQSRRPGERARSGTAVDLVIASPPLPEPSKPTDQPDVSAPPVKPTPVAKTVGPKAARPTACTVPDILKAGPQNARKALEDAGLKLGRVLTRVEGLPYQDPKAGVPVVCGSAVDVAW